MNTLRELHEECRAIALSKIEKIARRILKKNDNLNEFVMGMGMASFDDKEGEMMEMQTSCLDSNGRRVYEDVPEFKELIDFLDEWDGIYSLTGETMRFTAEGPKKTEW